jgi:uroporphyrinogen decarboxylase
MLPRERIQAVLQHREPDRVPRFEIWIDALIDELGASDPVHAYAHLGQDCVMIPSINPAESNAWRTGVDELGRVWRDGKYVEGVVNNETDLRKYSPPMSYVDQLFNPGQIKNARGAYPNHCLIFGTHIGSFTAAYMAMGFERFFFRLLDEPSFVHKLLEARTEWCIAVYQKAVSFGAELLVLGDDAGGKSGLMISPNLWREMILPYHCQIVKAVGVPMIWHSDGDIAKLLPMAIEAGFVGIHGLDPCAGMDLGRIKKDYGQDLVLVGNVDIRVLFGTDLRIVRDEIDRCISEGAAGGGYMIASCNSICEGMNPVAVQEMFRYVREVGYYPQKG